MQNSSSSAGSLLSRAFDLHRQGRLTQAEDAYRRLLHAHPAHFDAIHMLGVIAYQRGDYQGAVDAILHAVQIRPQDASAHSNLGNAFLKLGRHADALTAYRNALRLKPDFTDALSNLGSLLHASGRSAEALDCFAQALASDPHHADVWINRADALQALGRYEEALAAFDQALALRPDAAPVHRSRGVALAWLDRHEEALAAYAHAVRLDPGDVQSIGNRGNAYMRLGRHAEALSAYAEALRLKPDFAEAHFHESLCRLSIGDFEQGWRKYEWRRAANNYAGRGFGQPLWLGRDALAGKSILLHAEQGLGDTIQFSRYARLAAARGATVLLEVQPALKSLLSGLEGVSTVFARGETLPATDYHCPLLSLPLAFETRLDSIPATPSYLHADPARAAAWRVRLGERSRPRIGFAWAGSAVNPNDHRRSMPLEKLLGCLPAAAQCITLQKEVRPSDQALLTTRGDLCHFGEALGDFSDTAALIDSLDLVISVDTAVAHLAAAMGKPAWILLACSPDWRWLQRREDSPWYPSVRLFRQPASGDWDAVIAQVAQALQGHVMQDACALREDGCAP